MTVEVTDEGVIVLAGVCAIEDAEMLLRRLSVDPEASVDWSGCEKAHSAVVQLLLAAKPRMVGDPLDPFLRRYVRTMIERS